MGIQQGIDIVHINKFRDILARNSNLISDIFTDKEAGYCLSRRYPHAHLAARFAAKEACLKAMGIGFSGYGIDHTLKEIEIMPAASGRLQIILSGWLSMLSQKKGINRFNVSISHSDGYAAAMVILAGGHTQ